MSSSNQRSLAQDSPQEENNLPSKVDRNHIPSIILIDGCRWLAVGDYSFKELSCLVIKVSVFNDILLVVVKC